MQPILPVMAISSISTVVDAVSETASTTLGSSVSGWISDGLQWVLNNTIFRLLYWISVAFCWLIGILYDMFEVMAGLVKVSYDGEKNYLINIFFANSSVTRVYWGMAMIGFALCFAFTIIAVIKKMFDIEGKMQQSLGMILGNCVKSILMICLMSAFMTALLNMSNVLIQQVMYVFNNSEDLGKEKEITYTDEEYAAMARVLSTIGNYSLNPSWTSRYNINSCFNDFREDLQWLYDQEVFDVYYDENIIGSVCWQSELQRIVYTADLTKDQPLDVYNENLTLAIEHTVEVMQTNRNFVPISSYKRTSLTANETVPLDRVLFLASTMRAANNDAYNKNASFTDALRGPYYSGDKSIYDFDTVSADFNIGMATDYILLFLVGWIMIKDLAEIIFTCVSRIFNMILLYLISPPLIAATPLDGGGKLRQWITAMVVQSFGVFGTIISMRIMMLLIPVMLSDRLVLFSNVFLNILGKVILIMGALEVEKKAQGLITGILADNAGFQAINAGDMKSTAGKFLGGALAAGTGAAKVGLGTAIQSAKAGWGATKLAGKGALAVGKAGVNAGSWAAKKIGNMFSRDSGAGGTGSAGSASGGSTASPSSLTSMGSGSRDSGIGEGIELQDLSGIASGDSAGSGGSDSGGRAANPTNLSGTGTVGRDSGIGEGIELQDLSGSASGDSAGSGGSDSGGSAANPMNLSGTGTVGRDSGTGAGKSSADGNSSVKAVSGQNSAEAKPKENSNGAEPKKAVGGRKRRYDPLSNPGPNNEAMKPGRSKEKKDSAPTPAKAQADQASNAASRSDTKNTENIHSMGNANNTENMHSMGNANNTENAHGMSNANNTVSAGGAGTSAGRTTSAETYTRTMPGKKVTDGSDPLSQMSKMPSKVPPKIPR